MRLPRAVIDAVRGVGGAAVIVAVSAVGAGCGGAAPGAVVSSPARTTAVSANQARTGEGKADPVAVGVDPEPDWAAACGRG